MTREEIEKEFPIGSRVIRKDGFLPPDLSGQFAKIIACEFDSFFDNVWLLSLEWEDSELQLRFGESQYWHLDKFNPVHGPAVQEPDHEGMVYNPYTKQWSWF